MVRPAEEIWDPAVAQVPDLIVGHAWLDLGLVGGLAEDDPDGRHGRSARAQLVTTRAPGRRNSGSTNQGPRAQPGRLLIRENAECPPQVVLAKTIPGVGLDQLARVFGHIVFIIEDDVARRRLGLSDDPRLDLTTT